MRSEESESQKSIPSTILDHPEFGQIEVRYKEESNGYEILSAGAIDDLHVETEDLSPETIEFIKTELSRISKETKKSL